MEQELRVFSAVHALIVHRGKFLTIKQVVGEKDVFWDLPGGKVKHGESPYDTVVREVKEETGLGIDAGKPVGMWWFYRVKDGNQIVSTVLKCRIKKGKKADVDLTKNPTQEVISESRWVTKEQYLRGKYRPSDPSLRALIKNIL